MSTDLNLLSDTTFGSKMDTQNGILTDIKDGLTGGSNAVTAGTITDGQAQLYKGETAFTPAGAGGGVEFITPKPPSQASNNDDFFITNNISISSPAIAVDYSVINNMIRFTSSSSLTYYLCFKSTTFNINSINDVLSKFQILPYTRLYTNNVIFPTLNEPVSKTINSTTYYYIAIEYNYNKSLAYCLKVMYLP